jgi:hypothetical protein
LALTRCKTDAVPGTPLATVTFAVAELTVTGIQILRHAVVRHLSFARLSPPSSYTVLPAPVTTTDMLLLDTVRLATVKDVPLPAAVAADANTRPATSTQTTALRARRAETAPNML